MHNGKLYDQEDVNRAFDNFRNLVALPLLISNSPLKIKKNEKRKNSIHRIGGNSPY
jgi:hypothetical protein